MAIIGWRIYYAGGRVISSRDVAWEDAPQEGVLVVNVYEDRTYPIHRDGVSAVEHYMALLCRGDYYWRDPTGDFHCGTAGEAAEASPTHVKLGEWVSDEDYGAVYSRANNDRVW
jgi:hypothetical protein